MLHLWEDYNLEKKITRLYSYNSRITLHIYIKIVITGTYNILITACLGHNLWLLLINIYLPWPIQERQC